MKCKQKLYHQNEMFLLTLEFWVNDKKVIASIGQHIDFLVARFLYFFPHKKLEKNLGKYVFAEKKNHQVYEFKQLERRKLHDILFPIAHTMSKMNHMDRQGVSLKDNHNTPLGCLCFWWVGSNDAPLHLQLLLFSNLHYLLIPPNFLNELLMLINSYST